MAYQHIIHEPLDEYVKKYKEAFRKNAAEAFEELVRLSGVDAAANKKTCRHIRSLEKHKENTASHLEWMSFWSGLCILFIIGGSFFFLFYILHCFKPDIPGDIYWGGPGFILAGLALFIKLRFLDKKIETLKNIASVIRQQLQSEMAEAYRQMAPLNQLYRWDTVPDLVMKSCPVFTIDKFFSSARMAELEHKFGLDKEQGKNTSVCFCHSGSINDNPFVFADTWNMTMGTKTYWGSIIITWEERVTYTDSEGRTRSRMETRTQTLTASVEKPCPEYFGKKLLIFGCGAAPDLTFSRAPEDLAASDGFFQRMKLKSAINCLIEKSNDMSTPFTIMSNHEFDAVFGALDRSDEKDFRLLFTPLAQQEMLKLLRDTLHGFGENFIFLKKKMINFLYPGFMQDFDISAKPSLFHHYDLEVAEKIFRNYSNDFFRRWYFAFAPLLAIPLYQQHEAPGDIFQKDVLYYASNWEYETIANYFSRNTFKHPSCITDCILKTSPRHKKDGTTELAVTSYGFGGVTRVDYIPVFGGDGCFHDVPVEWIEYYPLTHTTSVILREISPDGENQSLHELFPGHKIEEENVYFRRNIAFYIPRG